MAASDGESQGIKTIAQSHNMLVNHTRAKSYPRINESIEALPEATGFPHDARVHMLSRPFCRTMLHHECAGDRRDVASYAVQYAVQAFSSGFPPPTL